MAELIPLGDKAGLRTCLFNLLKEFDDGKIESIIVCFERKGHGDITNYWHGSALSILGMLQVLTRDLLDDHFPIRSAQDYDA